MHRWAPSEAVELAGVADVAFAVAVAVAAIDVAGAVAIAAVAVAAPQNSGLLCVGAYDLAGTVRSEVMSGAGNRGKR